VAGDPEAEAARLVAQVAALGPRIRERAREAEARGRLTDDVFAALVETGVFRALAPRRWGGLGLGVRCLCDLARTLARFDASAAWVTAFLVEHNWMICRMGLAAQQELFASGRGYVLASAPLAPGGAAVRVPGGFRLRGRWRYASGVAHAEWTLVCCTLEEGGARVPWMFLVPVSDVKVLDEWQVSGMCATSSTNLSAADLFVPESRALELARFFSPRDHPGAVHAESIYRYPILPGLLAMLAAIALGSAEGALELARAKLFETAPWGVPRIDRAPSRARWAAAHQDVRCAALLHEATLARVIATGEEGRRLDLVEDGQLALDVATITRLAKGAIASLVDGCGSGAFQLDDPLQRFHRDVTVMASHLGNDWDVVSERAARWILGLGRAPTDPFF
jgi:3-hydroxy-9,10-secoandrosta-1,3,5(10)-triene-9,17-dione monooxygenase